MADKYLTFRVRDESYGVPVSKVREIVRMPAITPVPQSPPYVQGVFNLRSKAVPVVDLCARLGGTAPAYTDRTCIVVVDVDIASSRVAMGVAVEAVSEVLPIPPGDIDFLPELGGGDASRGVVGVTTSRNGVTLLLDLDRLFGSAGAG